MLPLASSMERWRAFFAQADSDLWTIIDQAVLLAASDFPAEFRHKRCEIAETLFAKRTWPPEHSNDATMVSRSVVTNATAYVKNGSHNACRLDADTPKHVRVSEVGGKVADTYSLGSDSKASAVDRHVLGHEYRNAEPDTGPGHHGDFKGDTPARDFCGLHMDHTVQEKVGLIKDKIMDSSNQSEDEILECLKALEDLEINVKILKETDIGRAVNKFRKHLSGPIRILAKQLVRTWKGMVDEWVKSTEVEPSLNVHATGVVSKMEGIDSKLQGNPASNSATTCMPMPKQYALQPAVGAASVGRMHPRGQAEALPGCNQDLSLPGRKLYSEHVHEEMGSSRVESDELDKPGTMEKRIELSGYPAESSRCIVMKGSTGGSGPGRPVASVPELKRGIINNDVAFEHRKDLTEKVRRTQNNQGDFLQKTGHGKSLVAHATNQAAERQEITKRRLSSENHYVENAKKQRDLQTSSRADLSKGVFTNAKITAYAKAQHHSANKW